MRVSMAWLGWMWVAACCAIAQPQEGDIVFGSAGGNLFYADNALTASAMWPNGFAVSALSIKTSGRNDEIVFTTGSGLAKIDDAGVVTSLSSVAAMVGLELTPAGIVACSGSRIVDAITGATVATIGQATCTDLCRNLDTGDIAVVGTSGFSGFVAVADSTGRVTTLTTLLRSFPDGICYLPDVDRYCVTSRSGPALLLSSAGATVGTVALSSWRSTYDQRTRVLYLGDASGAIHAFTNRGVPLGSLRAPVFPISFLDVFGDQNVSVRSTSKRGATVTVDLRFKRAGAGRAYCAALSFGIRPGFALPGGYVHLQPDPLFVASVCGGLPAVTNGFVGTLGPQGAATASFAIPMAVPVGTTVYVQATAVDPGRPSGLEVGNTECIRVVP